MLSAIVLVLATLVICRKMNQVIQSNREVVAELQKLRLTSRARVKTMKVRSGARTEVEELARMGRATRAKRVVVGGDPDSRQFVQVGGKVEKEATP